MFLVQNTEETQKEEYKKFPSNLNDQTLFFFSMREHLSARRGLYVYT